MHGKDYVTRLLNRGIGRKVLCYWLDADCFEIFGPENLGINYRSDFAVWLPYGMFGINYVEIGEIPIHLNNRIKGAGMHHLKR